MDRTDALTGCCAYLEAPVGQIDECGRRYLADVTSCRTSTSQIARPDCHFRTLIMSLSRPCPRMRANIEQIYQHAPCTAHQSLFRHALQDQRNRSPEKVLAQISADEIECRSRERQAVSSHEHHHNQPEPNLSIMSRIN